MPVIPSSTPSGFPGYKSRKYQLYIQSFLAIRSARQLHPSGRSHLSFSPILDSEHQRQMGSSDSGPRLCNRISNAAPTQLSSQKIYPSRSSTSSTLGRNRSNVTERSNFRKSPGFYSTFFLVAKKDGGQRPILNLKPLNQFVKVSKFKMCTPQTVIPMLHRGEWLASIDLKDAYFYIPIVNRHRPYLRFAFEGRVFQFNVLPFGLSTAPRVFTKMLAPVIGFIHE